MATVRSLLNNLPLLVTWALLSLPGWAQTSPTSGTAAVPPTRQWTYYASALGYGLPDGQSYVSPVLTADRGTLHLEARYNYESQRTGSLWIGRNFSWGKGTTLELTPMIGGVFGEADGIAPGMLATLVYRKLSIESQSEYLFETDLSESFFYSWSEIFYSPREWVRAGIVLQRTKAYQTEFNLQRGVFGGLTWRALDITAYVLDPGTSQTTPIIGIGLRF